MKHYRFFTTDHLKLKEGNPRSPEAANWDWRGLWTIQKYANSKSNKTEYVLKDYDNNEYATFAPAETALIPKGGKNLVQGILWNMHAPVGQQGIVTTIKNATPSQSKKNYSLFMSVLPDDDATKNGNRTVDMDFTESNLSKWLVVCK
jgi:hypothetical protein